MKKITTLIVLLLVVLISSSAYAFFSAGRIDSDFDYKDFKRDGDGYTFTLVNKSSKGFSEFYVIVYGYSIDGNVIYRKRFYVEFLGGREKHTEYLPGYNPKIFRVSIKFKTNIEVDTRSNIDE